MFLKLLWSSELFVRSADAWITKWSVVLIASWELEKHRHDFPCSMETNTSEELSTCVIDFYLSIVYLFILLIRS
jgi:hypothetical protein